MIKPNNPHYQLGVKFYRERGEWHDQNLWEIRKKRDRAVKGVSNWEFFRKRGSEIKSRVVKNLPQLIEQFTANAQKEGIEVYFASTAQEHNQKVLEILQKEGVKKVVKSKSMLTEECGLNPFLERNGIEVIDTDLGERIVQLRKEPPSHIVLPAIHLKKEEVAEALGEEESDPIYLTRKMRQLLRQEFLSADAGITGANFLVAQKGWAVVATNEGNADLGATLSPLHIISVGVDKLVESLEDVGVLLKMLARNATGQPITTYTTFFGAKSNGRRVVILVDNGRLNRRGGEFEETLKCIRCSACLTTCPVFRRSGGHSYRYPIPGPIGSLLAPLQEEPEKYRDLPFACTLCGSCEMVCPVEIPFTKLLIQMRRFVTTPTLLGIVGEKILHSPTLYRLFAQIIRLTPPSLLEKALSQWSKYRKLPQIPKIRWI
ncbi:MAG: 4Fe-4S ferredoxin [Epsilonproteobacteria bacterium]|jgi:L-lactate dehydrogenase complex protein LldF|nr:4Fe-4S ferredoxin [Campylobacterota bacterium]NPA89264.1 lactate utilization protein [Campylobacterota bacterium]